MPNSKMNIDMCSLITSKTKNGQFARHLRAETGFTVDDVLTRYDGEPFEPAYIAEKVTGMVAGREESLQVDEGEAREMAYHFSRIHLKDKMRPARAEQLPNGKYPEPTWEVELIDRVEHTTRGTLVIGMDTGSIHAWQPVERTN